MEHPKENGTDLINETNGKSCCHAENNGIENAAFEASALTHTDPHHSHAHREEIGLEGINYKPLCSCDETGIPCKCGSKHAPNRNELRTVTWGKWKCIALSLIVGLTLIWLTIFLSLLLTGVI